jgi:hypothetical protein
MESQVLADLVPFLPSILKKVPWQARATLLALALAGGIYLILCGLFGWSAFTGAPEIEGALATLAGVPGIANVTVKKGDTKSAYNAGYNEALAAVVAAKKVAPPSVVTQVEEQTAPAIGLLKQVEGDAPAIASIAEEATAIAPIPPEVAKAVADLAGEVAPTQPVSGDVLAQQPASSTASNVANIPPIK